MSDRAAIFTISWATAVWSACSSTRSSRIRSVGDDRAALIEIPAQMIALARPHRVKIRQRVGDRGGCAGGKLLLDRLIGVALPLADGQRLRQPQKIAGSQGPGDQAAVSRLVDRRGQRVAERLVELHFDRGGLPELQRNAQLDAPARDAPADERSNLGLDGGERLRDSQLQVQVAMVQRPDRHRHCGVLVLAGDRRKAGHALDHGSVATRRSPFLLSSSCI
jgi:hypothetical protein